MADAQELARRAAPVQFSEEDIRRGIEKGRALGLSEDEIWAGTMAHPEISPLVKNFLKAGGTEEELKGFLLGGPRVSAAPSHEGETNWGHTYETRQGPVRITPEWGHAAQVADALTFGHLPELGAGLASIRAGYSPWDSKGPYTTTRDTLRLQQEEFQNENRVASAGESAVGEAAPLAFGIGGVNSLLAASMGRSGVPALRAAAPWVTGTAGATAGGGRSGLGAMLARVGSRATSGALQGVEGDLAGRVAHMGDEPQPEWLNDNADLANNAELGAAINTALGVGRMAGGVPLNLARTAWGIVHHAPTALDFLLGTHSPHALADSAYRISRLARNMQRTASRAARLPAEPPIFPLTAGIMAERPREFAEGGEVSNLLQPYMQAYAGGGDVEDLRQRLLATLPGMMTDSMQPVEVNRPTGSVYSRPLEDTRESLQPGQDRFDDLVDPPLTQMSASEVLGAMGLGVGGVKIPRTFRARQVLDALAQRRFKGTFQQILQELKTGGTTDAELVHHGLAPHSSDANVGNEGAIPAWMKVQLGSERLKKPTLAIDPTMAQLLTSGDEQPWYRSGGLGAPTRYGNMQMPHIGGAPYEMQFRAPPEPSQTADRFPYLWDLEQKHLKTPGQLFHQRGISFFDPRNAQHGGGQSSLLVDELQADPLKRIREWNSAIARRQRENDTPSFTEAMDRDRVHRYTDWILDAQLGGEQSAESRNSVLARVEEMRGKQRDMPLSRVSRILGIPKLDPWQGFIDQDIKTAESMDKVRRDYEARAYEHADNQTLVENRLIEAARARMENARKFEGQHRSFLGATDDEWVRWNMAEAVKHAVEQGQGGVYLREPRAIAESHNLPPDVAEKLYGIKGALGALGGLARDYGGQLEEKYLPNEPDLRSGASTFLPITPEFRENMVKRGLPWFYADGGRVDALREALYSRPPGSVGDDMSMINPPPTQSVYSRPEEDTRESLRPGADPFEGLTEQDLRQLSPGELLAALGGGMTLATRGAPLKGMFYRPGANALMPYLKTGTPLRLEPEVGNLHDPNAVKVLVRAGAIPRELLEHPQYGQTWMDYVTRRMPFHLGYIDKLFAPSTQRGLANYDQRRLPWIDPESARLHMEGKTPYVLMEDSEP